MEKLDLSIFPEVDKASWEILANKQLKGEDPNDVLKWQSIENIDLLPYYDSSDLQGLDEQVDFFEKIPNHRWKLYEEVYVSDAKKANENALKALIGGCDGVIFRMNNTTISNELLQGIDSNICDLSFLNSPQSESLLSETNFAMVDSNYLELSKNINSAIDQLVEIVNIGDQSFIYRNAFSDFFLEIASLRAARFLLNTSSKKSNVKIHTNIPNHENDDHQWFLNTSAGLASILGGSHSVSFTTLMGNERISRNVGNLIREESGIGEYSDQCRGSYYVEVLTHKLISETLKKMQS